MLRFCARAANIPVWHKPIFNVSCHYRLKFQPLIGFFRLQGRLESGNIEISGEFVALTLPTPNSGTLILWSMMLVRTQRTIYSHPWEFVEGLVGAGRRSKSLHDRSVSIELSATWVVWSALVWSAGGIPSARH